MRCCHSDMAAAAWDSFLCIERAATSGICPREVNVPKVVRVGLEVGGKGLGDDGV